MQLAQQTRERRRYWVSVRRLLIALTERQISDETRLRRVVALFQRRLGDVFGNAQARRRNRRYELDVAVYEKPLPGGRAGFPKTP